MDDFDRVQIEQENNTGGRLMSESVSLESAKRAFEVRTYNVDGELVTDVDVRDEMTATMMRCSPCVRKEK